jgi:hypothetical protein
MGPAFLWDQKSLKSSTKRVPSILRRWVNTLKELSSFLEGR